MVVHNTIRGLAPWKAPGPDGLSSKFYKILIDQVTVPMVHYYNSLLESRVLRPEAKNAYVEVLPKPEKDPLYLES